MSAPNEPNEVYVYQKPSKGWKSTTQTAILSRAIPGTPGYFGYAIAVSNNTIVVGDPGTTGSGGAQGVVDIFAMPPGGWVDGTETAELSNPVGTIANFGAALAFDGSRIAVGTFGGAAFVYNKPAGRGWQSSSQPTATIVKGTGNDAFFGISIAIANQAIVVGDSDATDDGVQDEGAGDVFAPVCW